MFTLYITGASAFGLNESGGNFYVRYYTDPNASGTPGTLYPIINCYDQAAMVQVLSTLSSGRASWLYLRPYGYINTTWLIGIGWCNNPFYQFNGSQPMMGTDDTDRLAFDNHVFNGQLDRFNIINDRIYDACAGPHTGNENSLQYLNAAIDTTTTLYATTGTWYGTEYNITQRPGVTPFSRSGAVKSDAGPGEHVKKLVERCTAANDNRQPHFQTRWDDLSKWVKSVLGDGCNVAFHDIHFGDTEVVALWHLTGVNGVGDDVSIRVRVETRVGGDEKLDVGASGIAATEYILAEVTNTQLDIGAEYENIGKLWVPAQLDDYAESSIQYAADILQGRILAVSGNTVIDIRGGASSTALIPTVRSLLQHTTAVEHHSLHVPLLTRHELGRGRAGNREEVRGIASSFEIKCQVEGLVSSASAHVEDFGLLLASTRIETEGEEKISTVTFTFVTRKVGTHDVDLKFAEAVDLTVKTERIQVKVIDQ